tara:strand:+ start:6930 stop:7118 length:189 start_codon:yes stop_codon:yes gene_type:complete
MIITHVSKLVGQTNVVVVVPTSLTIRVFFHQMLIFQQDGAFSHPTIRLFVLYIGTVIVNRRL